MYNHNKLDAEQESEEISEETPEEAPEEISGEEGEGQAPDLTFIDMNKPSPRLICLYGEIEEEKCSDAVLALEILKEDGVEDEEGQIASDPIKFYISTFGGSAADMFAVYDAMRMAKDKCDIHTYGMGKVMSAGVLLLAAGTKGERRIGANCRVMLHSVISGQHGSIHDLENEVQEVKFTQKLWTKALLKETNMSEAYLRRLMRKKVNVYFDAEKAVELGIADIII